jgi:hypothetical protein
MDTRRMAVAEMAKTFDRHQPGWHERINTRTLNMGSSHDCVIGQVFPGRAFTAASREMYELAGKDPDFPPNRVFSGAVREMWIEEIEARRSGTLQTELETLEAKHGFGYKLRRVRDRILGRAA